METNKNITTEFHAVDYMRQIRTKLTTKYLQDKTKYLEYLKRAMEDFKLRQKKAYS